MGAQTSDDCHKWRLFEAVGSNGGPAELSRCLGLVSDVDSRGLYGRTALMMASSAGNAEAVRALIAAGADVRWRSDDGHTALHEAAESHRPDICVILLGAGADVDARGNDGITPLMCAARSRMGPGADTCSFLLDAGADANARDDSGTPVMMHAVSKRNDLFCKRYARDDADLPCLSALIQRGAEVDARDGAGDTPLIDAVQRGSVDLACFLAENGASLALKNHRQTSAWDRANGKFRAALEAAELRGVVSEVSAMSAREVGAAIADMGGLVPEVAVPAGREQVSDAPARRRAYRL